MGVRSTIVAYCRKQLGCAYSYTPSGGKEGVSYNCSFLSTCAFKAAGLTIPRWQGHQNGDGSQSDWVWRNGHWTTDPSKLKPGDLVFFGSKRTNTTHVGVVSKAGSTPYIIDSTPSRGVAERKLPLSAGFVGGGWPMKSLPADEPTTDTNFSTEVFRVASKVTFKASARVYKKPVVAVENRAGYTYKKGETVVLDGLLVNGGYVWGTYIGANTGARRYVIIGNSTRLA